MTIAILLGALALFDAILAGFRAAAGRDGRIEKRVYFRAAYVRGLAYGLVVIAVNAGIAGLLVATSNDRDATWRELVAAGSIAVWVFGAFATATFLALAFWLSPVAEYRLIASIIVLGPLTMLRPLVIAGGLVVAVIGANDWRVWVVAVTAGISMIGLERVIGRDHANRWRRLV